MTIYPNRRFLAAGALAAALAGCGGNNGGIVPTTTAPPANSNIDYRTFIDQAFANSANAKPVSVDFVSNPFSFDDNDNPTAFDSLIASGSFGGS